MIEDLIKFELFLYGDDEYEQTEILDVDFWVNRIVNLPANRPFCLQKAVQLCIQYCQNSCFRELFLKKSVGLCPVLTYKLYKSGVYRFDEIKPFLEGDHNLVLYYYFRKEIPDFNHFIRHKRGPYSSEKEFFEKEAEIDLLIEYGFVPGTLEYCMKYDDIDVFREIFTSEGGRTKWSPFEWSRSPVYIDFLSFSGFFGSVQCFKHLLMNGYELKLSSRSIVVCSGNLDLFHLCREISNDYSAYACFATEFCRNSILSFLLDNGANVDSSNFTDFTLLHFAVIYGHLSLVDYLVKKGADINALDASILFFPIITPLFIMLPRDIIVLSNS